MVTQHGDNQVNFDFCYLYYEMKKAEMELEKMHLEWNVVFLTVFLDLW